jgi:Lipid A 3-O-deacylase (PagL)
VRLPLAVALCLLCLGSIPWEARAAPEYVDVLAGQSKGTLELGQPSYTTVGMHLAYGHCAQDWLESRSGLRLPGHWTFEVEPWLEGHTETPGKFDLGASFNLRIDPGGDAEVVPYIKAGTGMIISTRSTEEQSTQWNFSSFGGAGIEVKAGGDSWVGIEYRIRHFSNLSVLDPNSGVDTTYWLLGFRQMI